MIKDYKRLHLRAPFYEYVLYNIDGHIFKTIAGNISEGGLLLKNVPHIPEDENEIISFAISIPQMPYLKNYNLERLRSYTNEIFTSNIIKLRGTIARKIGASDVDQIFLTQIGIKFIEPDPLELKKITDYVNITSSNIIYLLMLIDTINDDEDQINKVRHVAKILGYDSTLKISLLRHLVHHDYQSLQWL